MHKTRTVTNMNVDSMLLTLQFGWIFEGGTPVSGPETPQIHGQRGLQYSNMDNVHALVCIKDNRYAYNNRSSPQISTCRRLLRGISPLTMASPVLHP